MIIDIWLVHFTYFFEILLFCGLHEIKGFIYPSFSKFLWLFQLLDHDSIWWMPLIIMTKENKMTQSETDEYWGGSCGFIWKGSKTSDQKEHGKPLRFQEDFREWYERESELTGGFPMTNSDILCSQSPYIGKLCTLTNWTIWVLLRYTDSPAVNIVVFVFFFPLLS